MTIQTLIEQSKFNQADVAKHLGMTARNLRNRIKAPENFTFQELQCLYELLPEKKVISIIKKSLAK